MFDDKKLSVSAAFTTAGRQFYRRPFFCIGLMLIIALTGMLGSWLIEVFLAGALIDLLGVFMAVIAIGGIGFAIYSKVLELGFKKIALQLIRGDDSSFRDIIVTVHQGVRYIVGVILFNLLVVGIPVGVVWLASTGTAADLLQVANTTAGSLALAVVLGLGGYLALIFHLFPFVLLDQNYGVVQSFHVAWSITENAIFDLVIFYGVVLLLNLIGALLFMVGLLVTVPITVLAQAHVYQQLSEATFSFNE